MSESLKSVCIERSRRDLEWPVLLERIAALTRSPLGRQAVLELGPAETRAQVEVRQETLSELLRLSEAGAKLPVREFDDVGGAIERARRHGVLSVLELGRVRRLLDVALGLSRFAKNQKESAPLVFDMLALGPALSVLFEALDRSVDEAGEIRDTASPELGSRRSEVRVLQRQVQRRIGELIGRYREALQDGFYAERDGRYVLPVRSDAPFRVEGIVLGTSSSGSTLYVEPREMSELGNRLRLAEAEVEREIARVLATLSEEIGPLADELKDALDVTVRADLLSAVVEFACRVDAVVVPLADDDVLDLREARHPLLAEAGALVVANDLLLSGGRGLILSGPNAGGKTVAMKCLGLIALLQASGLPLPVHGESRVGYFPEVYSDIGDDQSLSQSLSTFSGHVERVRDILEFAAHGSLVLLDELMGGTDPNEGAVLAMATVDTLVRAGAAVAVTTHHEALKEHASRTESLDNAAAGFDFDAMAPTFEVTMGRAGASSALSVAARHGLPQAVTALAEAYMPEVELQIRKDRLDVEQLTVRLGNERLELAAEKEQTAVLNRRLALEAEKLKEARRSELVREGDELRASIRTARAELRSLRARMKSAASADELRQIEQGLDQASSIVSFGSQVDQAVRHGSETKPASSAPLELTVGMRVRLIGMKTEAEVIEAPRKGQVRVLAGGLKLSVSVLELEVLKPKPPAVKGPSGHKKPVSAVVSAARSVPVRSEDLVLDLRGRRVEESLDEVDRFIDSLLLRQEFGGYVLHGHGTGALKEAVRVHLRAHGAVVESRSAERDEGGDAFSIFWLAGG